MVVFERCESVYDFVRRCVWELRVCVCIGISLVVWLDLACSSVVLCWSGCDDEK